MSEALQQEIRHLRTLDGSDRDPRGRVFLPLAAAHLRHGELGQAEELLREGLTRHPEFVAAHVLLARVHEARGNEDEAQETWAAARRLDPDNVEAMLALGRILVARGEEVGAELVLRARAADPTAGDQMPDADLVSIGDLAPDRDDPPLAAVPVSELAPDEADVVSIADLAPDMDAQAPAVSEPAPAAPAAAAAPAAHATASREPPRPAERRVVTRTLAELLAGQGQRDRAIEMYEELVARSPGVTSLETRLRELRDGPETEEPVEEEEVDPRLTRPEPDPDSPTPFTWTEATSSGDDPPELAASAETAAEGPANDDSADPAAAAAAASDEDAREEGGEEGGEEESIADYLGGLLSYSPSKRADDPSAS